MRDCFAVVQTTCCLPSFGATLASVSHLTLGVLLALLFDLMYFVTLPGDATSTTICIFVFTFLLVYLKLPPLFTKVLLSNFI